MVHEGQIAEIYAKVYTEYAQNPDMSRKVRTTISIDERIKMVADLLGLNMSQIAENAILEEAKRRIDVFEKAYLLDDSSPARIRTGVAGSRVRQD